MVWWFGYLNDDDYIIIVMKGSGQPPMHVKKGIKVLQTQQTQQTQQTRQSTKQNEFKQKQQPMSEMGSIRSSRSRGISMSRESGINLDRIYEAKHFLPPKPANKKGISKGREGQGRTLLSCKSLEFIRSQETISKGNYQDNFQELPLEQKKEKEAIMAQPLPYSSQMLYNPVEGSKTKISKSQAQSHFHPNIISF